ncbi:MAG: MmgE/PrpD family protein [bacterium]
MAQEPPGLTRRLARFITGTSEADLPGYVYEHAKVALLDWYAVAIAGKDDPLVLKLIRVADLMGGSEQATLIGHGLRKSACQAALVNGAASHALDYDDTLVPFLGHPSVTIFPSLLALAEWKKKSGEDLLTSYLIGLKVGAVLGAYSGLSHYMAGWHGTSTMGHLASAAACARLLRLSEQETVHALGIAATQASGLKRVFGTMCKPFHAGRASQAGLLAVLLAAEGFDAPEDTLEGPQGFFDVLKGDRGEQVLDTLGKTWEIENLSQKYHASCHFTHSPIEAALKVAREENLSPAQIRAIRVRTSQTALSAAHQTEAKTGLAAKFCIPYCVANALITGRTGIQAFSEEWVGSPQIQSFMKKVTVGPDGGKAGLGAIVEVETTEGKLCTSFSDILQEVVPLETKREKIRAKFYDLCLPVLGPTRTTAVREAILSLDRFEDMQPLFQ